MRRYAYADHPAIQARAALFHLEDVMGRPDQELGDGGDFERRLALLAIVVKRGMSV